MIPNSEMEAALASLLALFGADTSGCRVVEKDGELHLVRASPSDRPE